MFSHLTSSFKWLAKRTSQGFQHEDKPVVVVLGATGRHTPLIHRNNFTTFILHIIYRFAWNPSIESIQYNQHFLVLCSTGAQGSSVVKALLESGKYRVRGVTRNPDSDRAQTLKDAGVELVKAEQHHCEEMKSAMEGAYAVYVVRCMLTLCGEMHGRLHLIFWLDVTGTVRHTTVRLMSTW